MILLKKISRFFNTVKYLKTIQIFYRLYFKFYKPINISTSNYSVRKVHWKIRYPTNKKSYFDYDHSFDFMKIKKCISSDGWSIEGVPDLWKYHLHYFDDLNSDNSNHREEFLKQLLLNWIKENKEFSSIGWDPYPTSLRMVNIIKWIINGGEANKEIIQSLKDQFVWLSKRIEWHLLGNHLFANAKALFFASLFFEHNKNKKLLDKSVKIINKEISEQILEDGGHFELSPMYHAIFLEDLLDIINLSLQFQDIFDKTQIDDWKNTASRMLIWLKNMTHPDGGISFFNDAAFGISKETSLLVDYSNVLGISNEDVITNNNNNLLCNHMKSSGYIYVKNNSADLYIDVANIGAEYLPGHGHADVLSFELSIDNKRIFVNSGTSTYEESSNLRQLQRSTMFHNTVTIQDQDSSEVWKSFRVGRRATPQNLTVSQESNKILVKCSHDGYRFLKRSPIHTRTWKIELDSIEIKDEINIKDIKSNAYYILHPNVKIENLKEDQLMLKLHDDTIVNVVFGNTKIEVINHTFSPEFGVNYDTKAIKVNDASDYSCRIYKNIK